ncbi:MAG: carbohydrate binding family 9 domain-containing protein [Verrucomicrobiae bacterium]|nr:carbohydrate binding family 9 domain-containing protein [Verrucomicrobiae bacterium]
MVTGPGKPASLPGMRVFTLLAALQGAVLAWPHSNENAGVPSMQVLQVDEPLTVDGVLDEPFWQRCEVGAGLIDTRTHQPAADQTRIRYALTKKFLYVAVECLDSDMSQIHATEQREDRSFVGDDFVEVHLDPPHSHRGKYAFFSNPLGTRADANEGPSGQFNYGWSADWDCAATLGPDRWTFEMRIPLKVLNYFRKDGQTWGMNITRVQRRNDVTSFWSYSPTDMYKPRHFGHLTGMNLAEAEFDRNWEVTPYVSGRADFNGETEYEPSAGIDVSTRITPAITAALTINPDFGQIEADDDTIELRDTERFLPEKRLFFREGEELVRMPHRLYYSRRFTDIDAGLKSSGLLPGYSFFFQNLQSDLAHDGTFHGNSTVIHVNQNVRERSYVGYYGAFSALDEGHSVVGSADGYFFLSDAWRMRFQGSVADEQWSPAALNTKDSTDFLGHAALIYDLYPWSFALSGNAITEEFNPLLGYIPRQDIFGPTFEADYHHTSGDRWYKDLTVGYDVAYYVDHAAANNLHDHAVSLGTILRNDLGLGVRHARDYHLPYHNHRTAFGVDLWASDYFKAVNLDYALGEFEETDYHEAAFGKRIKFWEKLPIREELVVRFEDRPAGDRETVWLNRVVFDLYLRSNMWVKSSIQMRSESLHNYSIIYGWEFRHRAWFYLAFNDVEDTTEASGRSLFAKVAYTF